MTPPKCTKCGGEMISYVDGKGVTYCKGCDRYWTAVARLTAENAAAHDQLRALQDSDMPADLPGAVGYLIEHSNAGWMCVADTRKANAELGKQIAQLTELIAMRERIADALDKVATKVWADHEATFAKQRDEIAELRAEVTRLKGQADYLRELI